MFERGDKVIYKSFGVCVIEQTDYVMESVNSAKSDAPKRTYFVLKSQSAKGGQAYVPADKAEELMRLVIDRADAVNLAHQLENITPEDYIEKNMHTTEQHFREQLAQHDCFITMKVARTMEHRIAEQEAEGHKPSGLYIRLLETARDQVREEYAASLGISIEEADEYLRNAAEQKSNEQ